MEIKFDAAEIKILAPEDVKPVWRVNFTLKRTQANMPKPIIETGTYTRTPLE